jgi:hypothetical protein
MIFHYICLRDIQCKNHLSAFESYWILIQLITFSSDFLYSIEWQLCSTYEFEELGNWKKSYISVELREKMVQRALENPVASLLNMTFSVYFEWQIEQRINTLA